VAKYKWLYISFLTFIVFITILILMTCNFFGIGHLRGVEGSYIVLFFALSIAISILVFVLQFMKLYGFSIYGRMGMFLIPFFVFIYVSALLHFSKQYCH